MPNEALTILGDDLYSRQPFCQAVKDKHLHFILVCKPDSPPQPVRNGGFSGSPGGFSHQSGAEMEWTLCGDPYLSVCQPAFLCAEISRAMDGQLV